MYSSSEFTYQATSHGKLATLMGTLQVLFFLKQSSIYSMVQGLFIVILCFMRESRQVAGSKDMLDTPNMESERCLFCWNYIWQYVGDGQIRNGWQFESCLIWTGITKNFLLDQQIQRYMVAFNFIISLNYEHRPKIQDKPFASLAIQSQNLVSGCLRRPDSNWN